MKQRLIIGWLSALIACLSVQAESIKVRIQTRDGKIHIGSLQEMSGGSVLFDPSGAAPAVRLPAAQIGYVQFPVDDDDEERIKRLFNEGRYRELAEPLDELLPPYMDYIGLPSNLSRKFLRWMVVSYWTDQFDRVLMLADELKRFPDEFEEKSRFYRGLVLLEKDDFQALDAFLSSVSVDAVYPPESAVRLYLEARRLQHQEEYIPAIRTAARLMAIHSGDADWMPKAELLCAELYFQMDMPESAQAVLADIREFYADPNIKKKAAAIAARN